MLGLKRPGTPTIGTRDSADAAEIQPGPLHAFFSATPSNGWIYLGRFFVAALAKKNLQCILSLAFLILSLGWIVFS
jgi:hypothetical protein